MEIVRCDSLEPASARNARQLDVQFVLGQTAVGLDALILQLDVEVALVEAIGQLARPLACLVELTVVEQLGHDAGKAGGAADDAMAVLLQLRIRGTRLVVEVVDMRLADKPQQVVVALGRLRKQKQMVELRLAVARQRIIGREVDFATIDGLDLLARLLLDGIARIAQFDHAAHDAMVGDGNGWHVEFRSTTHHILDVGHAVEQGIFGMVVQMNKSHGQSLNFANADVTISRHQS